MGHDVEKTGGGSLSGTERLGKVQVQLRRQQADVPLDLPDALATATRPAEEPEVVAVGLGMIGTNQTQQGALPRAVRPQHRPTFSPVHGPGNIPQNQPVAIADIPTTQLDNRFGHWGRDRRWGEYRVPVFRRQPRQVFRPLALPA